MIFQQQAVPEFPVGVVIAVIGAIVSFATLAAQWRKDVKEQRTKMSTASAEASDKLFDQYQEELRECGQDRMKFRAERADWEKEREELVGKVRKLDAEKTELSLRVNQLQADNIRLQAEVKDLAKRLAAALEG